MSDVNTTTYTVGARDDSDLTTWTAADLAEKIHTGDISSVDATRAHLDRISAVDGDVHAFLHVGADEALAAAEQVDKDIAAGDVASPLAGVPLALKDVSPPPMRRPLVRPRCSRAT